MADLAPLLLSVALGIGLAAACGLRVFLPLFVTSVLAHFDVGGTGLREGFSWLASGPAMIALGTAMVVEVLAYYIPLLDHALDVIAVPLSTAAGTLVAISTMVDLPPGLAWGLAIVAGGGVAGLVSAGTQPQGQRRTVAVLTIDQHILVHHQVHQGQCLGEQHDDQHQPEGAGKEALRKPGGSLHERQTPKVQRQASGFRL